MLPWLPCRLLPPSLAVALLEFHWVRVAEILRLVPVPAATLAAPTLALNPTVLPIPFAGAAGLEYKESVEVLLPVVTYPPYRSWCVVPFVLPAVAALHQLDQPYERVVLESVYVFYQVGRALDLPSLPRLLPVLLRLLAGSLQESVEAHFWSPVFLLCRAGRALRLRVGWLRARLLLFLLPVPVHLGLVATSGERLLGGNCNVHSNAGSGLAA